MYVQFVVKIDLVQYQVFVLLYVWMVYYAHVHMHVAQCTYMYAQLVNAPQGFI